MAARYLGVSEDVFSAEVEAGVWPAPRLRGAKGGLRTWDRRLLDAAADAFPEAAILRQDGNSGDAADPDQPAKAALRERIRGETEKRRSKTRAA
jgi:hypothetical protein